MLLAEAIKPDYQGKVRDIYDLGDKLLLVASDRISAFDYILPDVIPYKGEILTRISIFWFDFFKELKESHFLTANTGEYPEQFQPFAEEIAGRSMLVKKAEMFPVECIVRGYLSGSVVEEYKEKGTVGGVEVETGLVESSRMEWPIYTPTTKAPVGEHDMPISLDETIEMLGGPIARGICADSISAYEIGRDLAWLRGLIIADTKMEFGLYEGRIILADEFLTPDSSRFWPKDEYEPGHGQKSFDKQIVRDWLKANWDFTGEPPCLPEEIIKSTSERYIEVYQLLTKQEFKPMKAGESPSEYSLSFKDWFQNEK
ncbi:MAG: phosphoribosylaminoimidazolesuccinocarboxamide synthase [Coriobacteriales bacterium]|jgi:phosphoribosylaminoimidazole-succinocarboxamide synthase|nr:phosphoribosylaminoimidazolesuccinocarboxamide synthase [Coriobacteriales bacterium]